mgnify:CR=1 FL=1
MNLSQSLEQTAQKCPWCFQYLLASDSVSLYNGDNPIYNNWMCHTLCNMSINSNNINTDNESDDENNIKIRNRVINNYKFKFDDPSDNSDNEN